MKTTQMIKIDRRIGFVMMIDQDTRIEIEGMIITQMIVTINKKETMTAKMITGEIVVTSMSVTTHRARIEMIDKLIVDLVTNDVTIIGGLNNFNIILKPKMS